MARSTIAAHFSRRARLSTVSLGIKSELPPERLVAPVRAVLRSLDPEVPAAPVRNMYAVLMESAADWRWRR